MDLKEKMRMANRMWTQLSNITADERAFILHLLCEEHEVEAKKLAKEQGTVEVNPIPTP